MSDDLDGRDEQRAEALAVILRSHVAQLAEHFDSVQVVATAFCAQTGTDTFVAGEGNYYARLGATEGWVRRERRR
jgi:hypothetical protein